MNNKKLNIAFKIGQLVECNFGINKGVHFKIVSVIESKNKYGLNIANGSNNKLYGYDDTQLIAVH